MLVFIVFRTRLLSVLSWLLNNLFIKDHSWWVLFPNCTKWRKCRSAEILLSKSWSYDLLLSCFICVQPTSSLDKLIYWFFIEIKNDTLNDSFPGVFIHPISIIDKETLHSIQNTLSQLMIFCIKAYVFKTTQKVNPHFKSSL